MIICRLGSFEILELLHSFMGSTSLNLCVSLCLCLLWRDIQGILIEGIFIRFFSYSSYSGLFLDGKTREFVRFDSKMEEGGCFWIFSWFFNSFAPFRDVPRYDSPSSHSFLSIEGFKEFLDISFFFFLLLCGVENREE